MYKHKPHIIDNIMHVCTKSCSFISINILSKFRPISSICTLLHETCVAKQYTSYIVTCKHSYKYYSQDIKIRYCTYVDKILRYYKDMIVMHN